MDANEYYLHEQEKKELAEEKRMNYARKKAAIRIQALLPFEIVEALTESDYEKRYGIDLCNSYLNKDYSAIGKMISEIAAEHWRPIFINQILEEME